MPQGLLHGLLGGDWALKTHKQRCQKIADAEAVLPVNGKKWLVRHMHVQLKLDKLRGPQTLGSL